MDKIGERLAFERTGTRLYEALVSKHEAFGSFPGGPSGAGEDALVEPFEQAHATKEEHLDKVQAWLAAGQGRVQEGKCQAESLLFETLLRRWRHRQLVNARGRQRPDSTHILAAVRALNRLEVVGGMT